MLEEKIKEAGRAIIISIIAGISIPMISASPFYIGFKIGEKINGLYGIEQEPIGKKIKFEEKWNSSKELVCKGKKQIRRSWIHLRDIIKKPKVGEWWTYSHNAGVKKITFDDGAEFSYDIKQKKQYQPYDSRSWVYAVDGYGGIGLTLDKEGLDLKGRGMELILQYSMSQKSESYESDNDTSGCVRFFLPNIDVIFKNPDDEEVYRIDLFGYKSKIEPIISGKGADYWDTERRGTGDLRQRYFYTGDNKVKISVDLGNSLDEKIKYIAFQPTFGRGDFTISNLKFKPKG